MEKLAEKYDRVIKKQLFKGLSKKNIFEVPKIEKVVVSIGIGDLKESKDMVEKVSAELAKITGQKPKLNLSRKAVSAFKLRVGQPVGLTVTLRGRRMYDFLERLINVSFPRVRDFRGIKQSAFDGRGNYSLGIREHVIFPEIRMESSAVPFGLEVNVKTTANNDQDAKELLLALGFPFEKK
jgi:large subunit ribosomal protein L5